MCIRDRYQRRVHGIKIFFENMSIPVLPYPSVAPSIESLNPTELDIALAKCANLYVLYDRACCCGGISKMTFYKGLVEDHDPKELMTISLFEKECCCCCSCCNCNGCCCDEDEISFPIESKVSPNVGSLVLPLHLGFPWLLFNGPRYVGKYTHYVPGCWASCCCCCCCVREKIKDHSDRAVFYQKPCSCDNCCSCCACCKKSILLQEFMISETEEPAFSIYQVSSFVIILGKRVPYLLRFRQTMLCSYTPALGNSYSQSRSNSSASNVTCGYFLRPTESLYYDKLLKKQNLYKIIFKFKGIISFKQKIINEQSSFIHFK
eukprot:TRINITY_DN1815_c0_g1_i1.p1 TRINITY_DN1815_c0_g1~~TRINITY_DN1815_c0_g1_i1.p1  ORF type:complete len:319 (+),score=23.03 TRINITY_DN1815_c0_g1_i1:167-1123(+)